MYRFFLAVVGGLAVAGAVLLIAEPITSSVYPPPTGMDRYDRASIKAYWNEISTGYLLCIPLRLGLATLAGTWAAGAIARRARWFHALLVGVIMTGAGIATLALFPSPGWMWALGMLTFPIATLFGTRLAPKRHKPLPPMVIPVRVATR
jgi:hypothetical protein